MSDQTADAPVHKYRTPRTEYRVYFTIIFLFAVPFAILSWAWTALRTRRRPAQGPITRAWTEAQAITPLIFSAH